jgi:hypothetical protein
VLACVYNPAAAGLCWQACICCSCLLVYVGRVGWKPIAVCGYALLCVFLFSMS